MLLPDEFFDRFRTLSLERVRRVEASWNRIIQDPDADHGVVGEMLREVHTLKGDAAIIGYHEVLLLCQKLEDLLEVVNRLTCDVSEDLDLVVTMSIQFLGMLLRMKPGSPMTGLDLDGFVRQCDDVLRETKTIPVAPPTRRRNRNTIPEVPVDRVAEATRQRLASAATSVFLEYLSARGVSSRQRLRGVWLTLKQELGRMQVTGLAPLLERHVKATRELAEGLGKRVKIELELGMLGVEPRIAEAVDIAAVHLMRNAVDHGIESLDQRPRVGKPELATVRLHARQTGNTIDITVEDDGRGIDLARVRTIAVSRGLLEAGQTITDAQLLELVFEPGFSTRSTVTEISGRGVGLDAVKSAIVRVGGMVRLASSALGTKVTLSVPAPARNLHAYQFLAPGGSVALAVSARWTPSLETAPSPGAIDPLQTIQLFGSSRQTSVQQPFPVRDLTFRLRWGFLEVSVRSATEPKLVVAERICPTSEDHPVEVISVEGQETLLLRPEHVTELAAAWSARTAVAH
jgi:two-component system chemotaxis sensor kinase CheA